MRVCRVVTVLADTLREALIRAHTLTLSSLSPSEALTFYTRPHTSTLPHTHTCIRHTFTPHTYSHPPTHHTHTNAHSLTSIACPLRPAAEALPTYCLMERMSPRTIGSAWPHFDNKVMPPDLVSRIFPRRPWRGYVCTLSIGSTWPHFDNKVMPPID